MDNSFDRHVCLIIGYFWMNGSGKSRIPLLSLRIAELKDIMQVSITPKKIKKFQVMIYLYNFYEYSLLYLGE